MTNLTNQQKLEKLINKAFESDWDGSDTSIKLEYWNNPEVGRFYRDVTCQGWMLNPRNVLSDLSFIRALMPDDRTYRTRVKVMLVPNPVSYLYEQVFGKE
jgi:hypothetical protein